MFDFILSLADKYGPVATMAISVIAVALVIINRMSKTYTRSVESRLDDTETLREISVEDRSALSKAYQRNEILVQQSMDLLKQLGDYATDLALLKRAVEDEKEERALEKLEWERIHRDAKLLWEQERLQMMKEIDALKLRCTELETIVSVKEQIITQLKDRD